MFGGGGPHMSLLKMSEAEHESRLNTYQAPGVLGNVKEAQDENRHSTAQDAFRASSANPHLQHGLDRLKQLEEQ